MRVRVTKRHIAAGRRFHSDSCPIALALSEHFGFVCVAENGFLDDSDRYRRLPKKACAFIDTYDKTGKGAPFSFEIPDAY